SRNFEQFPDYYGSFKLYVGNPNNMQEARVKEVAHLRDGGTTLISYVLENKDGQLYFPSLQNKWAKASDNFDGEIVELERLVEEKDF
ncbi:MAG: hypothetical protein KJ592_00360, partial [Nanoarchaeota archaeon]|nr:hypothetical protein [Nanoarchaeota archaeon]